LETAGQFTLRDLGWNDSFASAYANFVEKEQSSGESETCYVARVAHEQRLGYRVFCEAGERSAILPSRFKHRAGSRSEWPAVGDWVVVRRGATAAEPDRIRYLFPRMNCLKRKAAGLQSEEQVLAANVDTAFVVMGLDSDFNLRRLERFLALIEDSGARGVILLNKLDLCENLEERVLQVTELAGRRAVHALCATELIGVEEIKQYLSRGTTSALIGSSGVGKTTIINDLLGSAGRRTGEVRERDGRGQHTTVGRDLILLPTGGLIIDNPGIREIQLNIDEDHLAEAFEDIDELAASCRFSDCSHSQEPGCAVNEAVESGAIASERLRAFHEIRKQIKEQQSRFRAHRRSRNRRSR